MLRSKVHLLKCVHRSNSSRKFIKLLLLYMLLVLNYCKGHSWYQNSILKTKKKIWVLYGFFKQWRIQFKKWFVLWLLLTFLLTTKCASVYSLALYRQVFSSYWMRLSRIWRMFQIKEGVINRGRRPWWITPSEICRILISYESRIQ